MQYSKILQDVMPNVRIVMDLQMIASDSKLALSKPPTLPPTLLFNSSTKVCWAFCRTNK